MHRRNYTLHVTLAAALVVMAAAAGRIERWEWKRGKTTVRVGVLREVPPAPAPPRETEVSEAAEERDAEVLVRFKPGVSAERVAAITARLNDRVEDEIESVEGLAAIDDLDDAEAEEV